MRVINGMAWHQYWMVMYKQLDNEMFNWEERIQWDNSKSINEFGTTAAPGTHYIDDDANK